MRCWGYHNYVGTLIDTLTIEFNQPIVPPNATIEALVRGKMCSHVV